MFSIVKIDIIKEFLNNYNIDYDLLTLDYQAIIVILSNILVVLFFFVCGYFIYRIALRMWSFIVG